MNNAIQFLLKHQFRRSKQAKPPGFTLLELLVAIILAALVITPLLGFMVNILATDRREQAKATSEQEIQAALDYIAQDLEQAVYIYDYEGLTNAHSGDVDESGIADQLPNCPEGATCTPVLVFWKRHFLDRTFKDKDTDKTVSQATAEGSDRFVYALVGYSLVEGGNGPWSDVARISRFEIRGGLEDDNGDPIINPSAGFAPFDLSGTGTLDQKMNQWEAGGTYDIGDTLIDYIDTEGNIDNELCGDADPDVPIAWTTVNPESQDDPNSFAACLNSQDASEPIVRVYIQGNALARMQNNVDPCTAESSFCPISSIQIKTNSFLYTQ
jgi:prepilin-type N-terminal cleavage/methylation domain-containing protein